MKAHKKALKELTKIDGVFPLDGSSLDNCHGGAMGKEQKPDGTFGYKEPKYKGPLPCGGHLRGILGAECAIIEMPIVFVMGYAGIFVNITGADAYTLQGIKGANRVIDFSNGLFTGVNEKSVF